MITIICGDRTCVDYSILEMAIEKSGFIITMVYSGHAKGSDLLGEAWAKSHNIPLKIFKADWNNTKVKGAKIKERKNPFNGKMEKFNCLAGLQRNKLMIDSGAECVIALQPYGESDGTSHTISLAKKKNIPIYVFEKPDKYYEYQF